MPDLIGRLVTTCEIEPPEITRQEIELSGDQTTFEGLIEIGALAHVGNADVAMCTVCDEPHSVAVEYAGQGRYRYYCSISGYQDVETKLLHRFAIADEWLARSIASNLHLSSPPRPEPTRQSPVIRIGRARFKQYVCEVFFARRLADPRRYREMKQRVTGLIGTIPAVVLTSTPAELVAAEAPPRCALLELADVLEITSIGTAINEGPFYAALRGSPNPTGTPIGFGFSPGFRTGFVGDQEYQFSNKQALAVEAMEKARHRGQRLHQTEIQGAANTSQRMTQLFEGNPAYGALIKHDEQGHYWLDL